MPHKGKVVGSLRLIADDLTGALDSSAPFASPELPVAVGLHIEELPEAARLACSTESRDLAPDAAWRSMEYAFRFMSRKSDEQTLWFKKIDSVLRGHPFAETLSLAGSGGFRRIVFAPAFPAMGRMTIDGRQFVENPHDNVRKQVGPDLKAGFLALDPSLRVDGEDDALGAADRSVQIVNAETQAELDGRIAQFRSASGRTLWAGAGGMAIALAGPAVRVRYAPIGLVIVGTRHPATVSQLQYLASNNSNSGARKIFAPAITASTPGETQRRISNDTPQLIAEFGRSPMMVVGGDTLSAFLRGARASHLECLGEAFSGVPISRVRGGLADGLLLLTKSGGFGDERLLDEIARRASHATS